MTKKLIECVLFCYICICISFINKKIFCMNSTCVIFTFMFSAAVTTVNRSDVDVSGIPVAN